MSRTDRTLAGRKEHATSRAPSKSSQANPSEVRLCPACSKEFAPDAYLDHVYDNDECYKAYLASEKKEMSKQ